MFKKKSKQLPTKIKDKFYSSYVPIVSYVYHELLTMKWEELNVLNFIYDSFNNTQTKPMIYTHQDHCTLDQHNASCLLNQSLISATKAMKIIVSLK